ncbi:MAG TPA: cobalamin-binding protein [Pseudomonas xinjiangensis]|uniref:Cobalamin-binding protein n=2 Tax=root TaxID=1 RepID=A0A7V1FSY0_9GAMM|nr:cobalamin-binding protein [Halopseudomonas xinjiangensis]HEC48866.1 cobalamin-binding protein [Halopseudomonas xinjiangensis]
MRGWLIAGLLLLTCLPGMASSRVVSLAPFLTDIVIMLDATDQLVGVLDGDNVAPELDDVPRIGGYQTLSLELIAAQKPEVVLAWTSGNPEELLRRLESWGITVLRFDPKRLEDITVMVNQLGAVLGKNAHAAELNRRYLASLQQLARPLDKDSPRVFIQLWDDPLYTVSGAQLIGDALNHCGAHNVFQGLPGLAPQVGREGVLAVDPDLIIVLADDQKMAGQWLERWRQFPRLKAVEQNGLKMLESDSLVKPTPVVVEGLERLCALVQQSR